MDKKGKKSDLVNRVFGLTSSSDFAERLKEVLDREAQEEIQLDQLDDVVSDDGVVDGQGALEPGHAVMLRDEWFSDDGLLDGQEELGQGRVVALTNEVEELDEFPEMQSGDPHPDTLVENTKRKVKACIALLVSNNVGTCRVGFVSKPFFYLYGNSLHNCIGLVTMLFEESDSKTERERSYRSNGAASIIIEQKQ
jgi:hypothetical protein